jgi:hypothetical protein
MKLPPAAIKAADLRFLILSRNKNAVTEIAPPTNPPTKNVFGGGVKPFHPVLKSGNQEG